MRASASMLNNINTSGSGQFNQTENDLVEPHFYLEDHFGLMIITATVIGFAAVIGTLGNILIILAVCCVRALRTTGNIFVLNLALADMVVTVLVDPFNVVGAVAGRSILYKDDTLCNYVASFCGPACLSSMWNMFAISLNRYCFICKPHLYPRIFTFKSCIMCCIGIWILAHLLHMPNHLGWGKNRFSPAYHICSFDMETHSYAIFYIVTGVIIPLIGVLYGYASIYVKVRNIKLQIRRHRQVAMVNRAQPRLSQSGHPEDQNTNVVKAPRPQKPAFTRDDIKLAKTLFAAFLTFLISWSLVVVFVLAHVPPEVPGWLHVTAVVMAHGNSAVNPILYGFTNEKFREGYRNVLGMRHASVDDAHKLAPKNGSGSLAITDTDATLKSAKARASGRMSISQKSSQL